MKQFFNKSISKPGNNPTGASEAPGKRKVVKNAPDQVTQLGKDKFSGLQKKASVKI